MRAPAARRAPAGQRGPWGALGAKVGGDHGTQGGEGDATVAAAGGGAAGQVRLPGRASPGSPAAGRWHSRQLSGGRAAPTPPREGGRGPHVPPLLDAGVIPGEGRGRPHPGGAYAAPAAECAPVCVLGTAGGGPSSSTQSLVAGEHGSLRGGPH